MKFDWSEELPLNCPPSQAKTANNEVFYRLCNYPVSDKDFLSHRALSPTKVFSVSECQARSLSIMDTLESAKKLLLLPSLKGKKIVKIHLIEENGLILQTGKPNHFSWWKSQNFDFSTCPIVG
ncbi:MAG: hypothetical protein MUF71_14300 [Candidatus Kapabacteria bacterium]|jgi:hypothetical protein|nr:hypothetical protein [Candidatus Kapabacteria bacterium]